MKKKMKNYRAVIAVLIGTLILSFFGAVSVQAEVEKFSLGIGLGIAPDYEGSDDYTGVPMLYAHAQWSSGRYVKLTGSKLAANIITHDIFRFGPVANYRLGRDDMISVDDSVVKKMKQVDDSFELGAFAGMEIDNWIFMVEALSDVSDGHDGFVLTLSGGYTWQVNNSWTLSLGASTSYADDDYMSSFFDVDLRDSQRSGLSTYDADSGFKDVGCTVAAVYKWTDLWSVRTSAGFTRLLNDAEDSPVVDDRGDENQFHLGVMAIYTF
jgi:outer membrane scaffolding protein for murein synthesis (MipA/OmpV family)